MNLSHRLVGGGRNDGPNFELFHEEVGNMEADGGTHGCTIDLFHNTYPGRVKYVFFETNSSRVTIWEMDIEFLWESRGPVEVCIGQWQRSTTGTEVKTSLTS